MAYIGPTISMADVVIRPSRSIIKQSYDARERRNDSSLPFHLGYGNLNGDGFGIGWFPPDNSTTPDRTPCVSDAPAIGSLTESQAAALLLLRCVCHCCVVRAGLHFNHPSLVK
jgi:predicted glutamine amidotransferase